MRATIGSSCVGNGHLFNDLQIESSPDTNALQPSTTMMWGCSLVTKSAALTGAILVMIASEVINLSHMLYRATSANIELFLGHFDMLAVS